MFLRLLSLCCFFVSTALGAQSLAVADFHFGIDESVKLIVARADLDAANAAFNGIWSSVRLGDRTFRLGARTRVLTYGEVQEVFDGEGDTYRLYFTELPLVHLDPYVWIPPDEKLPVDVVYADKDQLLKAVAGMETRGGFTSDLPKKTYDLEFWTDTSGTENLDVSFGDLRSDDDWILDAVYNEPFRVNAFVAHQLWDEVYRLPYADREPRARAGVGVHWCEVFREGRYEGVYFLSEQIDRKQLRLKKYREESGEVRGALYKTVGTASASNYTGLRSGPADEETLWQGFEPKYPDEDGSRWSNLYDYLDYAINSSDGELSNIFDRWLDLANVVDYYLFINLTAAEDNARKNIYYARYDAESPYLFIPWDFDGTFGNKWNGELAGFPTDSLIDNRLFERIVAVNAGGFNEALCERFTELESRGVYTAQGFNDRLRTQYEYLDRYGVYEREAERWPGSVLACADHQAYTYGWNEERLDFFGRWFCDMTTSVAPGEAARELPMIFPNPTPNLVNVVLPQPLTTEYEIRNISGRLIRRGVIREGNCSIDLSGNSAGLYLLRVDDTVSKIILR